MEVVGAARVTFSKTISAEDALVSLSRQGVLEEEELKSRANNSGELCAFVFDNYCELANPVSVSQLKSNELIGGANLVTAQKITKEQFEKAISLSSSESN